MLRLCASLEVVLQLILLVTVLDDLLEHNQKFLRCAPTCHSKSNHKISDWLIELNLYLGYWSFTAIVVDIVLYATVENNAAKFIIIAETKVSLVKSRQPITEKMDNFIHAIISSSYYLFVFIISKHINAN